MSRKTMTPDLEQHPCQSFTDLVKVLVMRGGQETTIGAYTPTSAYSRSKKSEKDQRREDILLYIDRIYSLMTDKWKTNYRKWWGEIIDHPVVASLIYNTHKQKDHPFDRDLVCNIIRYLGQHGMIATWNASKVTIALENNQLHSIRTYSLSKNPSEIIEKVLKPYTDQAMKKK